nr:unnamed protein product [Digitaria exilis]
MGRPARCGPALSGPHRAELPAQARHYGHFLPDQPTGPSKEMGTKFARHYISGRAGTGPIAHVSGPGPFGHL